MRQAAGQVARSAHRVLHLLLGAAMVLLLALAVLGWRLAQGPIELTGLARLIEERANPPAAAMRIEIGQVEVGWRGWRGGGLTPLELRVSAIRLVGPGDEVQAELPAAAVSLSIPWLLRGELAPRRLELRNPVLRLRRFADGSLALRLGAPPAPDSATAPARDAAEQSLPDTLLAELMHPPSDDTPLSALAELAISGARVSVEDDALGQTWMLDDAELALRRRPGGGLTGRGAALLRLGGTQVPVSGSLEASGSPATIALRLALPDLRPAELASLAPPLAPLAGLDAPVRLVLSAQLGADGALHAAGAEATAGAGLIDLGAGRTVPIAAAEASIGWEPDLVSIPRAVIRLEGPGTPVLAANVTARRADGLWRAEAALTLDRVEVAELHRWWPPRLTEGGARDWILSNITAGTVSNGRWALAAEAPEDLSDLRVTTLTGTLDVADATVHWLRPVPPLEGAAGRVTFGLDEIRVDASQATQSGTAIQAGDSVVRFLFTPGQNERAALQVRLAGPLPEVLTVLQHPRLHLFERRALALQDPQGTIEGTVALDFPLLNDLPVEELRIAAQAQLRRVRLGDILFGKPLEDGRFDLRVDTNGLRTTGNATLAGIAARIGVEMDFRTGGASQVVTRESVTARPTAAQLAALGLDAEEMVRGPVGLDVRTERRRNGNGRVTIRADLREASLAIDPLTWSKPEGQNAGAEAVLRLNGERLEAIESFRVEAPSLLLRGSAGFGTGTRLTRVALGEARIADSRFAGEVRPPARPGAPWQVSLHGPVLDLRATMAEESAAPEPAPATPPAATGPAVAVDAIFDRVLLGPRRELAALEARVQVDGRGVVRSGRLAGRAGPRGPFEVSITPDRGGRLVRVTAQDAGALLNSFDVLNHLEGGRLSVTARYAHDAPGAPLSGTAEMDDFSIRNAPAVAKLLQAMTLYGLVEALSGPGLGFSRMVAPFSLTPEALRLDDARAFSASLGITAKGTLDRRRRRLAIEGTIVPAYMFNSLLGNLPILGRLFSPEAGGGVFAATYRVQGPMDDPNVSVNPLAALTPGFLRGLFGIGQQQEPRR